MASSGPSRRAFLESAGATVGLAGFAPGLSPVAVAATEGRRPKVAAIATVYHYLSHAYHIVGRFLDGFMLYDGRGLYRPSCDLTSLFIEQAPDETDLGRDKAKRHQVRLSATILDALTLGTGKLAVDAVLLIGEHGDYPLNDKLQKLYPRGRMFREIVEVFRASGRSVPVFIDKHLSYSRPDALRMVETARDLRFPLMAGSSLPVTWRIPPLEIPLGLPMTGAIVASRGDIEIFGFHALETLQCMTERRVLKGKPQGVKAVICLEGDAVWAAGDKGDWSWSLLEHALGRSESRNPGDIKQNTRDYRPLPGRDGLTKLRHPIAFLVEYADGLRAASLILNGHVDDTTFAATIGGDRPGVVSTLVHLPAPPGARFFDPLVLRIEEFFQTGKPPYPVERTLLTGGVLDAVLESRVQGHRRIETPDLAAIDYRPPSDSGFIRSPLTREGAGSR